MEELLISANAYRRDRGIDVLLTSEWGCGVDNLVEPQLLPVGLDHARMSPAVGRLGKELAPMYHFAGGQTCALTLEPYKNHFHTTRFYGLAGSGEKVRRVAERVFSLCCFHASAGKDKQTGSVARRSRLDLIGIWCRSR